MTVEDGTGLENADSYVDIDFANAYFSARANDKWSELETTEKESLLVKSTDFIDHSYRWKGRRKTEEQGLNFPRVGLVNSDGFTVVSVPVQLKQAVCEGALISISENLFRVSEANGAVTSEKIGNLAFTYDASQKAKDETLYDAINLRLKGLYKEPKQDKIISIKVQRK